MRILYLFLFVTLNYSLRIFYKRIKVIRNPKKRLNRTIYVSNHAASFMDPLIIATQMRPIVFFMTRSDVFTTFMKPILWAAHMLPIYRQQDGVDTKAKNKEVFQQCSSILKGGRNLLIFGEGFTDDVFVRRLKPLKKGAVRIGFDSLESLDWTKNIYVATVGINYENPNIIGSEIVISNGSSICLNDFKDEYLKAPNKVIADITDRLELDLQNQLTYVENSDWVFFHEYVTRLTRIGMDPFDKDESISLLQRWENSTAFAKWINQQNLQDKELLALKDELEKYFDHLKSLKIKDTIVYESAENKENIGWKWLQLIVLSPFNLLGRIHNYLPYKLVKKFVEKSFKRRVFWGSVKLTLGMAAIGIWNIPLVIALHYLVIKPLCVGFEDKAWILSLAYYLIIPLFGLISYNSWRTYQNIKSHQRLASQLDKMKQERKSLLTKVYKLSFFSSENKD
jgi:1-acyl-sn-glycerol-3-phosphate acyltransferase